MSVKLLLMLDRKFKRTLFVIYGELTINPPVMTIRVTTQNVRLSAEEPPWIMMTPQRVDIAKINKSAQTHIEILRFSDVRRDWRACTTCLTTICLFKIRGGRKQEKERHKCLSKTLASGHAYLIDEI